MRAVLLPGLDGTGDLFTELVAHAPASFETQIISYPLADPAGYEEHARQVIRAVDSTSPFIILAESYSGPVAVSVAQHHPKGLRGLVLCNTFIANPASSALRFLPWELLFRFSVPRFAVRHHLTGPAHVSRFLEPIRSANKKVHPRVRAARMRELLTVDVRETFAALYLPILFLHGTRDNLVGPRALTLAKSCNPAMRVAEIAGPHLLLQVAPQECWGHITAFVSDECAA